MENKAWCFCDIESIKNSIVRESENFYSLFDDAPVSPGHILIVPKKHIVSILDVSSELWQQLRLEIIESVKVIEKTDLKSYYEKLFGEKTDANIRWFLNKAMNHPRINTKPDAYNHGVNDGREAGRTVDHLHWHIIPRFEGDMIDPRGGVRYVIPEMGNYKIAR